MSKNSQWRGLFKTGNSPFRGFCLAGNDIQSAGNDSKSMGNHIQSVRNDSQSMGNHVQSARNDIRNRETNFRSEENGSPSPVNCLSSI